MYSQKNVDILFVNLKILGKIKTQGNKLYTSGDYLILDDGKNFKQIFYRWWNNEDRYKTLAKIKEVVRDGINFCQYSINSDVLLKNNPNGVTEEIKDWVNNNIMLLENLVQSLEQSIIGINTLKDTYKEDSTLCSKLELEIELLEKNIVNFKNYLKSK